ncbi:MAG: hypothetical protein ACRDQ4_11900 [Pseudonocardiaceae bacterium]
MLTVGLHAAVETLWAYKDPNAGLATSTLAANPSDAQTCRSQRHHPATCSSVSPVKSGHGRTSAPSRRAATRTTTPSTNLYNTAPTELSDASQIRPGRNIHSRRQGGYPHECRVDVSIHGLSCDVTLLRVWGARGCR